MPEKGILNQLHMWKNQKEMSRLEKLKRQAINEANRRVLNEENWENTGWEDEKGKVTIKDVLEYIGDNIRNISVTDLQNKLESFLKKIKLDPQRIEDADLQYPIILVQEDGEFSYVIDGNHRLGKAIKDEEEYIKAKVLYLDDKNTPEDFKRLLRSK